MSASRTSDGRAELGGVSLTDSVWGEYCEAVRGLGELPNLVTRRQRSLAAEQETALATAVAARDAELDQAEHWRKLAKRAISNAQARLVTAKVLIPEVPDTDVAQPRPAGQLVEQLRQSSNDVDRDVATVRTARRRAIDEQTRERTEQLEARRQRLRLIWAGGVCAVVVVLLALLLL